MTGESPRDVLYYPVYVALGRSRGAARWAPPAGIHRTAERLQAPQADGAGRQLCQHVHAATVDPWARLPGTLSTGQRRFGIGTLSTGRWLALFWWGVFAMALGVVAIVLGFTVFLGDSWSIPIGAISCLFGGGSCVMVARANRRSSADPS